MNPYVASVKRASLEDGRIESEQAAFAILEEPAPAVTPKARFEIEATDAQWVEHLRPGAVAIVQVYFQG